MKICNIDMRGSVSLKNPKGSITFSGSKNSTITNPNIFSMTTGFEATVSKNIYLMTASGLKTFDKSQIISFVDGKFYVRTLSDMKKYSIVDGDLVEYKPATDKTVTNTNS